MHSRSILGVGCLLVPCPGLGLLQALQNCAARGIGVGSFLQVAGMRFAWNPYTRTVLEAQIRDRTSGKFVTLSLTRLYNMVTNDYILRGGDDYASLPLFATNANQGGPVDVQQLIGYVTALQVINSPTQQDLQHCFTTATVPLDLYAAGCRVVLTSTTQNLLAQCTSKSGFCNPGVAPVSALLQFGLSINTSGCQQCSGLGQCVSTSGSCACVSPKAGPFSGLSVVSGADCSTLRTLTLVSLNPGILAAMITLTAVSGVVAVATAALLVFYRASPVIVGTAPTLGT
jgi:hypothetical protein